VGRRSNSIVGLFVFAAVALVVSAAGAATLVDRARLREGPSKESRQLGWVEQGTAVTIEGTRGGWYAVRTPDGQTGYVWQEHLRIDPQEAAGAPVQATPSTMGPPPTLAPSAVTPATTPPPTLPPAPAPAPSAVERTEGGIAGELERLRGEVGRLTTAQQDLIQRLGRGDRSGGGAAPAPLGSDGSTGAAVVFFGAGAVVGWVFGRFVGRRDRRSRLRL
jgi:hypothetical protein